MLMRNGQIFRIALVVVLSAIGYAEPQSTLTSGDIADRTKSVYAECSSYHDTGKVTTVFFENDRQRTVEKPFQTAFVRPDRFRFEYRDESLPAGTRYIIWRVGANVQ